jgi:hypothetical protein
LSRVGLRLGKSVSSRAQATARGIHARVQETLEQLCAAAKLEGSAASHDDWVHVRRRVLAIAAARYHLASQARADDSAAVLQWLRWAESRHEILKHGAGRRAPGLFSDSRWISERIPLPALLAAMGPIEDAHRLSAWHEALLEWDFDRATRTPAHTTIGRKSRGSYLTSLELAAPTVRRALSEVVSGTPRVCDPACGAGIFLMATLDLLSKRAPSRSRAELAMRSLFGVDRDPIAVELCRFFLWKEARDEQLPLSFLDQNIRCGDALIGCSPAQSHAYPERAWRRMRRAKMHEQGTAEQPLVAGNAVSHAGNADKEASLARADLWCALWFWPLRDAGDMPRAASWPQVAPAAWEIVQRITQRSFFFHWELEFEDIFQGPRPGFDAMLGNPPWELAKPDSRQWFERYDAGYRALSKTEALVRQSELLDADPALKRAWDEYMQDGTALSHWVRELAKEIPPTDDICVAGCRPYRAQGRSDTNRYKLFLERSFNLCREGGVIAFLVPSGLYSDQGTRELRRLFVEAGHWKWLFAFDNSAGLFDIHRSYKFCAVIVKRGEASADAVQEEAPASARSPHSQPRQVGEPEPVMRVAFGQRSSQAWEEAEQHAHELPVSSLFRKSPTSLAIPEVVGRDELELFERMYADSRRLAEFPVQDAPVHYRREYDLTRDSHLFLPLASLEAEGYRADRMGRLVVADWRPACGLIPRGNIQTADGEAWAAPASIEHIALPLHQGVMIHQYRACMKGWVSGSGARATWRELDEADGIPNPQFYVDQVVHRERMLRFPCSQIGETKIVFRDVARATDERSVIATLLPDWPCANALGVIHVEARLRLALLACLDSFVFDWVVRRRLVGAHLNWFVMEDLPIPEPARLEQLPSLRDAVARLALGSVLAKARFAGCEDPPELDALCDPAPLRVTRPLRPVGAGQRRSLRVAIETAVAWLYGLSVKELEHVLFGFSGSSGGVKDDPRGFWRTDKLLPQSERLTSCILDLYRDIESADAQAIDAMLARACETDGSV